MMLNKLPQRNASYWIAKNKKVTEPQAMSCCRTLDDYLGNASLHGLRYIGDKTLTILERYTLLTLKIQYRAHNTFYDFGGVFFSY